MKIFMAGNPEIRIGLNEDFFIGKSDMLTQGILSARSTINYNVRVTNHVSCLVAI